MTQLRSKPYLVGYIIGSPQKAINSTHQTIERGEPIVRRFYLTVNGPAKTDVKAYYSYWGDGSQSFITRKSRVSEKKRLSYPNKCF